MALFDFGDHPQALLSHSKKNTSHDCEADALSSESHINSSRMSIKCSNLQRWKVYVKNHRIHERIGNGHMLFLNDAITSCLRLTATSNPLPHPYWTHTKCLSTLICYSELALCSYTHPTWLRFWGSRSHVEPKWCHYVMVEAYSHLKPLTPSILGTYKVFQHIDMLSKSIQY